MNVVVVAGPLTPGVALPVEFEGIESFVRSPRHGEPVRHGPCPRCNGTGIICGKHGSLRWMATCPGCAGTGRVEGVLLLRIAGPAGSPQIRSFFRWAAENRVRTDSRMALEDETVVENVEARSALSWCGFDGTPVPRRGGSRLAHRALGIIAERTDIGTAGHVAAHFATVDGDVRVGGVFDFAISRRGTVVWRWSNATSRRVARRYGIRFPESAVRTLVGRLAGKQHRLCLRLAAAHRRGLQHVPAPQTSVGLDAASAV
ncbi:MAG: hypothetical protein HY905_03970 [Deltaproteobacteria bacterium]|nr:hypothetical protein [Deltaproteobacteria bacterium]